MSDGSATGIIAAITMAFGFIIGATTVEGYVTKKVCKQSNKLLADYEECVANPPWYKK